MKPQHIWKFVTGCIRFWLGILYIIGLIIILIAVSIRGFSSEFPKILAYIGLGSFVGVYGFGLWKNRNIQN